MSFLCCFCFLFIKISKFALPGVMLMYERTSKDRKKERKKEIVVPWSVVGVRSESGYHRHKILI